MIILKINNILNNQNNMYFGHGTGTEDREVIESIMNNGLRCSHGSLYFTSVALGIGKQIPDEEIEMLKKWPHKDSKIVVIVSLPYKYKIIDVAGSGTYNQGDAAFYYIPNEETRNKYCLTNSPYVMPEFIVGYYDSRTDSFTNNPKYYENLSYDEQINLFNRVKENYFNIIDDGWEIDEYKEVSKILGWSFGLTDEEIKKFKRKKEENNLLSKIDSELLNRQMMLPNGEKISAKQYIQEIVLPYLPMTGFVNLNNGAKIPISHFIMECVLFDCQERYNGDFLKYMEDNVQNIEDIQLSNGETKSR